ncbi:hypothetical protein Emag_004389 [Eimeria magna]
MPYSAFSPPGASGRPDGEKLILLEQRSSNLDNSSARKKRERVQQLQQQQKQQQLASVCKVKVPDLGVKRGRGLVATQHIRRGEVLGSGLIRLCGLTCSNCLCFVGSLQDTLRHNLTRVYDLGSRVEFRALDLRGLNKMARCPVEKTDVMLSFARLSAASARKKKRFIDSSALLQKIELVGNALLLTREDTTTASRSLGVGLVGAGQCVPQVLFEVVYRSRELEAAMTPYKRDKSQDGDLYTAWGAKVMA